MKCADCDALEENPDITRPQYRCRVTEWVYFEWNGVPEYKRTCDRFRPALKSA